MRTHFNPKNNPRVIIIQKLYGKFYNEDDDLNFPKHRFKKFIKDIVIGTIERNDLILDELNNLGEEFIFEKLDKVFQTILKAATYEFMYKPNLSINIIIKEYLNKAGIDSKNYSGHSLRSGFATSAAEAGAEERSIMAMTGHKSSEMVRRYIKEANLFKNNALNKVKI